MKNPHTPPTVSRGFTLVELLVVMAVIAILASLALTVSGVVQKNGAKARIHGEIHAMSVACESYKSDNGLYPRDSDTDSLESQTKVDPKDYQKASLTLYKALSGDIRGSGTNPDGLVNASDVPTGSPAGSQPRVYYPELKRESIHFTAGNEVDYMMDPFSNAYGYSTAQSNYQEGLNGNANTSGVTYSKKPPGFNGTFDLWSTFGSTTAGTGYDLKNTWVTNW